MGYLWIPISTIGGLFGTGDGGNTIDIHMVEIVSPPDVRKYPLESGHLTYMSRFLTNRIMSIIRSVEGSMPNLTMTHIGLQKPTKVYGNWRVK